VRHELKALQQQLGALQRARSMAMIEVERERAALQRPLREAEFHATHQAGRAPSLEVALARAGGRNALASSLRSELLASLAEHRPPCRGKAWRNQRPPGFATSCSLPCLGA